MKKKVIKINKIKNSKYKDKILFQFIKFKK
jgi:hypothetical protein